MNSKKEFRDYLSGREFDKPFVLRDFTGFGGRSGQGGQALIGTETLPLVQVLAKNMGVKGFRTLSGLTSNISIPVQTTRNPVSVKGLRDAASNSNPVFTNKTLTPIKIAGATRIAKELLLQANDDVVAFIIDSLTREISYKMEDYMLGKVAAQAGNTVSYASLEAIDWDDVLAFESYVASYALTDTAFVMSPAARAALKGIEKAQNTAQFLCDGENRINGYACNVSGCVANDNIYFADWSKLIVGLWGEGMEVLVNPFSYAKEGDVEVVASVCMDAVCEQADAFVLGVAEGSNSDSNA